MGLASQYVGRGIVVYGITYARNRRNNMQPVDDEYANWEQLAMMIHRRLFLILGQIKFKITGRKIGVSAK